MITKRIKLNENWEPWIGEGYHGASSVMMVPKTNAEAVSCRVIHLEPRGHTGMHSHERLHHVIALEGLPELETDKEAIKLDNLVAVSIGANVPHRFINKTKEEAVLLVQNIFQK